LFVDRINRINWIFFFGRSPEESDQTPIASGEQKWESQYSDKVKLVSRNETNYF
jgi:hypothetical protein